MTRQSFIKRVLKPAAFILSSIPILWLAYGWALALMGYDHHLTFNPIEYTNRTLGDWALRFLLISLVMTPLKLITGSTIPIQFRRMFGLFAFTYVLLHVLNYFVVDQLANLAVIWEDILDRFYITLGMVSLILLIPLAITSAKKWVKKLGGKRWNKLHKLVYPAAILAVFHFIFMVKGNQTEPYIYAAILMLLFIIRLMPKRGKRPV